MDGREKDKRIEEWKREIETGMRMRDRGEGWRERKTGGERKMLRETGMGGKRGSHRERDLDL